MFPLGKNMTSSNKAKRLKKLILNFQKKGNSKLQDKIVEESIDLIRLHFQNPVSYYYGIIPTINFLVEYKIKPQYYINFADEVVSLYFSKRKRGQKRATDYINDLKHSNKFNLHESKIKLKSDNPIEILLLEVYRIVEISDCSKEEALKKVFATYHTGYTYKSFRNIFYKNQDISAF